MLDAFLTVASQHNTKLAEHHKLVDMLKQLPKEELFMLATDQTKLAYSSAMPLCGGTSGAPPTWLESYRGSPLYADALQIEQAALQVDIESQQLDMQDAATRDETRSARDEVWQRRDAINLQRRILDLRRAGEEIQQVTGESQDVASADPSEPEPLLPAPMQSVQGEKEASAKHAELPASVIGAMRSAATKARPSLAALSSSAPLKPEHLSRGVAQAVESTKTIKPGAMRVSDLLLGMEGKSINPGQLRVSELLGKTAKEHSAVETIGSTTRAGARAGGLFNAIRGAATTKGDAKTKAIAALGHGARGFVNGGLYGAGAGGLLAASGVRVSSKDKKEQKKEAFAPAALGGALKGIGGFAAGAGKNIAAATRAGGMKGGLQMAKNVGKDGVQMAGQFAAKNPGTAGMIGAGALGGAALLGRSTKD